MTTNQNVPNATAAALAGDLDDDRATIDEFKEAIAIQIRELASLVECQVAAGRTEEAMDHYESPYLVEYLTSRTLGVLCWFTKSELDKSHTAVQQMAIRLRGMIRSNNGSEVMDQRIQQQEQRIQERIGQIEILEAMQAAANTVHEEMTGVAYGHPDRNGKQHLTAAAASAQALVDKYAPAEEAKAGPKDANRPTTHQDGDDTYILGADGNYHKVA